MSEWLIGIDFPLSLLYNKEVGGKESKRSMGTRNGAPAPAFKLYG